MPAKHTYDLHYHNGHFYNPENGERLVLRNGAELQLTAHPAAFQPFEPAGDAYLHHPSRSEATMRRMLAADPIVGEVFLLLPAGAELRFVLHPPKPAVSGGSIAEYEFLVQLAEPLFVYHPAKPGKNPSLGSSVDCDCAVVEARCTRAGYDEAPNRLRYFEPIFARSINSLIKNTYVHYFHNAGAPGRSVFDAMLVGDTHETLGELRERLVPVAPAALTSDKSKRK